MNDRPDAVEDTPVERELRGSFLEYAMSVVVSRALPDARDGLKPVHRRILYGMAEQNLRPDRPHVKCAKVVGHVMGEYHPHGDSAIYDALVRMAQDFSMRLPLIDGHGNFGTHTDPPAAMRYTESRLSHAALALTAELDEDTVDFGDNYDGRTKEPKVLPAAFPNLLVNGTTGIAVGMATNMAPHNLTEVVAACRHLLVNPQATSDDLMAFVPGPDLPTGGVVIGLDGVAEAYRTGRGRFRMRAAAKITDVSARRKGIVVTELPYMVGPEKVIEAVKKLRDVKKLAGVSNIVDLTDRKTGLRLVIECKTGFNPTAVLEELYRTTPLETSFSVHNLALVDGQPRTLSLRDLVRHFVDHRLTVTRRRCEFRKRKAEDRAHILDGYVIALANIEEVVKTIRASKDTATARTKLMKTYTLSEIQATNILEMPLRRLTSLEVNTITAELKKLRDEIAELARLLGSDAAMRELVGAELESVVAQFGTPRRTKLLADAPEPAAAAAELEIPDEPCLVTLSTSGILGRFDPAPFKGAAGKHDVLISRVPTTARGTVALVTSAGKLHRLPVVEIPTASGRNRGAAVSEFVDLAAGEKPVALLPLTAPDGATTVAMATRGGVVKRLPADQLPAKTGQEIIGVKDGDELLTAAWIAEDSDVVFVTSDAQALRTPAAGIRPQGRTAGGMAGVRLADGACVVAFGVAAEGGHVVTVTDTGAVKKTPMGEYPPKGRATAGVRTHRFLKGETRIAAAWVGVGEVAAVGAAGDPVKLPEAADKRDAAGVKVDPAPTVVGAARR